MSVNAALPDLIPVRRIHNFVYCPRLMYFQFVENIFVHDKNVVEGEIVHRRVDVPTPGDFPENLLNRERETIRSLALASQKMGVCGIIDLLRRSDTGNDWILYDYKRGTPTHNDNGEFCAKEADQIQVQLYIALAQENGLSVEKGVIYYAETKTFVSVFPEKDMSALQHLIQKVVECAAGELPPPLVSDNRCMFCSMYPVCLPDESLYWKTQNKHVSQNARPPLPDNNPGEILIVQDPRAYLSKKNDSITVSVEGKILSKHPVHLLRAIFVYGSPQISTQVIHICLSEQIDVVYFSPAGKFLGRLDTLSVSGLDSRYGQYKFSENEQISVKIAQNLIRGKISNQRTLLLRNAKSKNPESLNLLSALRKKVCNCSTREELMGIEGKAAAVYFDTFPAMLQQYDLAKMFTGRKRRPPTDPVNAMLSLGYSVLSSEIAGVCAAVGLDPACGLLHAPRFGRAALALDLMEEFRPLIVDSVIISLINRSMVTLDDFIFSSNGCALKKSAHKAFWHAYARRMNEELIHPVFKYRMSYRRLIEVQVRQLWRIFRGDCNIYHPVVTR